MKYYKDSKEGFYQLNDDAEPNKSWLPISKSEYDALNIQPLPTKEQENAPIITKLAEIDIKSIRAIREYIASKADAPQFTKDLDAQAAAERAKLKK
ncbi:MAG: hypothetical protein CTY33_00370 [Methylotenera sp.]|nr:MAG: hypothetical protein CTY33_00370 [Methylotenera sp.]